MMLRVEDRDSEFVRNHSNHLNGATKQRKENIPFLLSNNGVVCPSFCIGRSGFSGINAGCSVCRFNTKVFIIYNNNKKKKKETGVKLDK